MTENSTSLAQRHEKDVPGSIPDGTKLGNDII